MPVSLSDLGKNICILGRSNSGKSTLAYHLAEALDVPCFHLDQYAHVENTAWQLKDPNLFDLDHEKILKETHWIIDGNYKRLMPERLQKASAVIWLDLPAFGCVWRYMRRSQQSKKDRAGGTTRIGGLKGAKQDFSIWLIKHMVLGYHKNNPIYHQLIEQHFSDDKPFIHLRSLAALNKFYDQLGLTRQV